MWRASLSGSLSGSLSRSPSLPRAVNGEKGLVNCAFLKVDDLVKRISDKQTEMDTEALLKAEGMTHKDLWMDLTGVNAPTFASSAKKLNNAK